MIALISIIPIIISVFFFNYYLVLLFVFGIIVFWLIFFWILEKFFDLELIHPNDHPAI